MFGIGSVAGSMLGKGNRGVGPSVKMGQQNFGTTSPVQNDFSGWLQGHRGLNPNPPMIGSGGIGPSPGMGMIRPMPIPGRMIYPNMPQNAPMQPFQPPEQQFQNSGINPTFDIQEALKRLLGGNQMMTK